MTGYALQGQRDQEACNCKLQLTCNCDNDRSEMLLRIVPQFHNEKEYNRQEKTALPPTSDRIPLNERVGRGYCAVIKCSTMMPVSLLSMFYYTARCRKCDWVFVVSVYRPARPHVANNRSIEIIERPACIRLATAVAVSLIFCQWCDLKCARLIFDTVVSTW